MRRDNHAIITQYCRYRRGWLCNGV